MKYIDIHAHVNFKDFDKDREEVIGRAKKKGVQIINIGTNHDTSTEVVRLTQKHPDLYAIVGLHPINIDAETAGGEFDSSRYEELLAEPNVVGVGECGLDYFHLSGDIEALKERQEKVFRKQIEMAIRADKPIMIHCRDAYPEVLAILRDFRNNLAEKVVAGDDDQGVVGGAGRLRGNVHFFAGRPEEAEEFLGLGFDVSFTGVITFAPQYRALVEAVPIDRMHAETDCPYVAPVGHRGERNEPSYVIEVVEKIAEIKGLPVAEVADQLMQNARRLFGVKTE